MILIQREGPSHWYTRAGTACHSVPRASGEGERPTTLRDARTMNLLPSVTNVLGCVSKPGLVGWQIEQGIIAALTLPRQDGELADAFARRVARDSQEQCSKAADLGTNVHAACEAWALRREVPVTAEIRTLWEPFQSWWMDNVEEMETCETVVVGPDYAGRVDLVARVAGVGRCVIDVKTQAVKKDKKGVAHASFYETWPMQLAAYRAALRGECACMSLVLGSQFPYIETKTWSPVEIAKAMGAFLAAKDLWKYLKNYDPMETYAPVPATGRSVINE